MTEFQPSIWLLGIRIDAPVTTLTDLVVSTVCFYSFFRLNQIPTRNKMHMYLKVYFFSMGLATAIGGIIGHGFLYMVTFSWKLPGWLMSMISITMLERASIEYSRKLIKPSVGNFFAWLNSIELVTFMAITFSTLNFFYVEVHSIYGLLFIVTSFNLYAYQKTKSCSTLLFLTAVGISALSAIAFMNKWGISIWFNYFDISHCLMAICAWFFYLGSRKAIDDDIVNE